MPRRKAQPTSQGVVYRQVADPRQQALMDLRAAVPPANGEASSRQGPISMAEPAPRTKLLFAPGRGRPMQYTEIGRDPKSDKPQYPKQDPNRVNFVKSFEKDVLGGLTRQQWRERLLKIGEWPRKSEIESGDESSTESSSDEESSSPGQSSQARRPRRAIAPSANRGAANSQADGQQSKRPQKSKPPVDKVPADRAKQNSAGRANNGSSSSDESSSEDSSEDSSDDSDQDPRGKRPQQSQGSKAKRPAIARPAARAASQQQGSRVPRR